jgi:ATP/maltotriose-dependent transcriptional regulator MalT
MCHEAEPVACALGDRGRRAKVCFLHGLSYCFRSEYKYAEPYFLHALKHLQEAGEDTLTASTTLALLYNAQGQWRKAAPLLTASIQTYEARQTQTVYPDWGLDYLPYAMCCVVLGHILALQGRVREAKVVVHKASTLALHRAANLVTKAHCAGWYSLVAAALGEDLGALAYAEDILTRTAEIEAPIFRLGGYIATSTALLAVEDFAGARRACEQALQAVAGTSHRDGLALVYVNLTRANLALGDWAAAQCAYQAGLPLVRLTPERDTPRFDCLKAQLLASGNSPDFAQAEAFFAKSMQADEAAGATLLAAQTCFLLAQMLLCKGDVARARDLFTTLQAQFRTWHVPVWQRKCKQALTTLLAVSRQHTGG